MSGEFTNVTEYELNILLTQNKCNDMYNSHKLNNINLYTVL